MSDRSQTFSAAVTYLTKVWMAGLGAALFVPLALAAAGVDLLLGQRGGVLDRVLDASAQLEATLDVHGARTRIRVVRSGEAAA